MAVATPALPPKDTRRVSRWDLSPDGLTAAAAVVPTTLVRIINPFSLGCQEPLCHWSVVRLPNQLTIQLMKRIREGGDRLRVEHVLITINRSFFNKCY